MDKEIEDINVNSQYQNDILKKEIIQQNLYIAGLQNELNESENTINSLKDTINTLKETINTIQTELENLKNNNKEEKSYFSYVYSIFSK